MWTVPVVIHVCDCTLCRVCAAMLQTPFLFAVWCATKSGDTHTQVEAHGIKSACPSVSLYVVANPVHESVMCQSRDGVAASRWAHKHRGEVGRTITMVLVAPGANSGHHFHLVLVRPAAPGIVHLLYHPPASFQSWTLILFKLESHLQKRLHLFYGRKVNEIH